MTLIPRSSFIILLSDTFPEVCSVFGRLYVYPTAFSVVWKIVPAWRENVFFFFLLFGFEFCLALRLVMNWGLYIYDDFIWSRASVL
jgi:hypothetical protein